MTIVNLAVWTALTCSPQLINSRMISNNVEAWCFILLWMKQTKCYVCWEFLIVAHTYSSFNCLMVFSALLKSHWQKYRVIKRWMNGPKCRQARCRFKSETNNKSNKYLRQQMWCAETEHYRNQRPWQTQKPGHVLEHSGMKIGVLITNERQVTVELEAGTREDT